MDLPEIVIISIAFILGFIIASLVFRQQSRLVEERARLNLERWQIESTGAIRKDSVNRSRSALKGRISEQLAPLLPAFPFSPADARFSGNPVDYIVFDGYTAVKDDGDDYVRVVLVEVKKGKGKLSRGESLIKKAVEEGRVSWKTVVIPDD